MFAHRTHRRGHIVSITSSAVSCQLLCYTVYYAFLINP
jgi:hypothetical protein